MIAYFAMLMMMVMMIQMYLGKMREQERKGLGFENGKWTSLSNKRKEE